MLYAVALLGIWFVALYCFRFDRFFGSLTFSTYGAFGTTGTLDANRRGV